MFAILAEVLPRAALATLLLHGGVSYLVVGPTLATRIVSVDFVPACERNHQRATLAAVEDQRRRIAAPSFDPPKEIAAELLRSFRNSAILRGLDPLGGGLLGKSADALLGQQERVTQAAREAYDNSVERLKRETATRLASAGTLCSCVADAAIAETRTEWAVYAGTISLVRLQPLQDFSRRMEQIQASGQCSTAREAAR